MVTWCFISDLFIYQCYVFACLVNFCNFHNYFMLFHAEFFNKINNQLNYWDTFIVPWSNCHNYAVFEFGKITAIKSCYYHAWVFFRSTFSNATCFESSRMMTGNFIFKTFSTKWQLFHTNGKLTKLLQALSPKTLHFLKTTDSTAAYFVVETWRATKQKLLFSSDIGISNDFAK